MFVQDGGSMSIEPPALTPKPAFSSLDRVVLVLTAGSWAVRPGSAAFAAQAGSAGFQASVPKRVSACRWVVGCDFLDLTLSSPWTVCFDVGCSKERLAARTACFVARWFIAWQVVT
jgi:hypothetical protein